MVTGHQPYIDESPLALAVRKDKEEAPGPRLHAPTLHRSWDQTILRCPTRLAGVKCRYFFLSEKENENGHRGRRPHDPDREFEPGDFEKLFVQVQETIELLVRKGVDRAAFAHALQSMMAQYPEAHGTIPAVDRVDGAHIVRMNAEPDTDAVGVERALYSALESKSLEGHAATKRIPASPTGAALLPLLTTRKASIFVSYAHSDERLLDAFRKHMAPLERLEMAEVWQ